LPKTRRAVQIVGYCACTGAESPNREQTRDDGPGVARFRNRGPTAYDGTRAEFSWAAGRAELDGLPDGRGLNIAHEAVDRYAAGPRRDRVALRWLAKDGERRDFTYADLRDETSRFANVLKSLGVGKGDPVAGRRSRSR
jgi:hypothetical protein